MARRRNPDPTAAEEESWLAFKRELDWQMARNEEINEARVPFEARVHEILSEAGASPLDPPSEYGGFTLDGIHFDYYPEGGYGYGRRDPSYENPKVHASTMGGNDDFPRSGKTVGWTHAVTPEEVAAAIIEYCQSRDGYDVRGHRSELTLRKNPRRRKNPVGMDAMYHALQQPRIPWASFSVDQIKTVAYAAMKNGDNDLYDKAVAALARRSR